MAIWILARLCGMPDWLDAEIVIVLAMAAGGIYVMWTENRNHRRDAEERIALSSRLAALETAVASQAPHSIAERVAELEGVSQQQAGIPERVAVLEARVDFRPVTHTRRKDGRFARPEEVHNVPASSSETRNQP